MDILEKSESVLKNHYIIFENIAFSRNDNLNPSGKMHSEISKLVEKINDCKYKVSLTFKIISQNDDFKMEITISGLFEILNCDDEIFKQELINKNTISILFPYLRSEITLLTAQPFFKPIIIPPININSLIDELGENADK